MKVVDLDEADTRCSIRALNDRGIESGGQGCHDGRFRVARGRQVGGHDFSLVITAPVVICGELHTIAIVKLERRIRERAGDRDGGANRAHNDSAGLLPEHNEAPNQDIVACLDGSPGGNVCQLGSGVHGKVVDLDQGDACGVINSANDRRVSAGSKGEENRGFMVVNWRKGAVDDLLPVDAVTPVIVRRDRLAGGIMQFQNRISQRARNWK